MEETYSSRMCDMLAEDRPRERLERAGAQALQDAELIALLLRSGTRDTSALKVAESLIEYFGDLAGLTSASLEQLKEVPGVGRVKAIELKAAIELARRLHSVGDSKRRMIRSPGDVAELCMADLRHEEQEHLYVLVLDPRNRVRTKRLVTTGTLTESLVHPREVFKEALRFTGAGVILVHNHPSGDPSPSPQDIATTRRIAEAGKLLGIELLDHVIIGDGRWASLKQLGLM